MATDKLLHFLTGIIIGIVFMVCTGNILIALAAVLAIGMLKEFWDLFGGNGEFDFFDILSTLVGGLFGIGFIWFALAFGCITIPSVVSLGSLSIF